MAIIPCMWMVYMSTSCQLRWPVKQQGAQLRRRMYQQLLVCKMSIVGCFAGLCMERAIYTTSVSTSSHANISSANTAGSHSHLMDKSAGPRASICLQNPISRSASQLPSALGACFVVARPRCRHTMDVCEIIHPQEPACVPCRANGVIGEQPGGAEAGCISTGFAAGVFELMRTNHRCHAGISTSPWS